ncbi:MAG: hypothetical protein QOF80_1765 [Verrucomicrobiota bacterium]|jgi:hypothetical protein
MWSALDAEFYLAFDAGRDDCVDLAVEHGAGTMLLLPTAYQEIADLCVQTQDEELRTHALDALKFMTVNNVLAAPTVDKNVGTDEGLAEYLMRAGILAEDQKNQALILAEAACLGVSCLLTLDQEIVAIDEAALAQAIRDKHLNPFVIITG